MTTKLFQFSRLRTILCVRAAQPAEELGAGCNYYKWIDPYPSTASASKSRAERTKYIVGHPQGGAL